MLPGSLTALQTVGEVVVTGRQQGSHDRVMMRLCIRKFSACRALRPLRLNRVSIHTSIYLSVVMCCAKYNYWYRNLSYGHVAELRDILYRHCRLTL